MKKTMRLFCLLLAALTLFLCFSSCGKKDGSAEGEEEGPPDDPGAGEYEGVYCRYLEYPDELVSDEFSIKLENGGTGVFRREGGEYPITEWTFDGENITITETYLNITYVYTGTLKDGKLELLRGDPSDFFACEYVLQKK